jgi:colanic acid/amylovoran biosynthesis glycosyltransferase
MRILFVTSIFPQLSQTFVLDQIRYARALGHAVTVCCKRFDAALACQQPDGRDLFAVAVYHRPRSAATVLRLLKGLALRPQRLGRYFDTRRALGLDCSDFFGAVQVAGTPDVILANFGPNGIVAARVKRAFFPAARLVVIFHGYDLSSYVADHGWDGYRRAAPAIDLAISVNRPWARLLLDHTSMARVAVHHLGVDLARVPRWRGHAGGPFSILFVGRMVEKKGFRQLVAAVARLKTRGRDVRVDAVGGGPEEADLSATVEAAGLGGTITLHGAKPHDFVLGLMRDCDCLALPSVTAADGDQEGIPVTLMEAMACGLPVVSTYHSGIPELVTDGETGLLVPERDVAALAGAIERLMTEEGLARRLADRARRFVAAEFNADIQNPALFDLILGGLR